MRTLQLFASVSVVLVAVASTACNRSERDANAQRTAGQLKAAAEKAGHQLADSWLTTKIQAQYFADDDIKARHINVSTRDAVVTLSGFVDTVPQRELAVQIARSTDGVRQVNDRLTLRNEARESGATATSGTAPAPAPSAAAPSQPGSPGTSDDALVTARIQSKFFVDDRVKARRIEVDTRNGVVTLSGEVADETERAQALLLARTTEGVVRVEDHLTVTVPSQSAPAPASPASVVDDARVTTTIQARYFVDPTVKGSTIDVSSKDGVVLLQGRVPTEAVRKQALAIAQNTEGVSQVVDRLSVVPAGR
jgi:hyperosmotically inducible protein